MVDLPYIISAPSMVFGMDLLENVRLLESLVDNIEIVLYNTPTLHNFPSHKEILTLKKMDTNQASIQIVTSRANAHFQY